MHRLSKTGEKNSALPAQFRQNAVVLQLQYVLQIASKNRLQFFNETTTTFVALVVKQFPQIVDAVVVF